MHGFAAARERESRRKNLQLAFAKDKEAMAYAAWEVKSAENQKKVEMKKRLGKRKAAYTRKLNARRRLLADLLTAESEALNTELANSFETMEQRRERLVGHANQLQAKREEERLKEVARLRALQWRDSIDEIRTYQSNMLTKRVAQERKQQLVWAKEARERERELDRKEEAEYAKRKAKLLRREIAEKAVVDERADLTKRMLAAQLVERDKLARRQAKEDAEELARLRKQWAKENQEELDRQQARRDRAAQIEKEVAEFNAYKKELDSHRGDAEAEEDRRLLEAVLKKEAAEVEKEKALKAQRKQEMVDYQDMLKEMMVKEQQDDSYLEQLLREERDKEWEKREAKWKAEADARAKLMREVDESRRKQIAYNKIRRQKEAEDDMNFARKLFADTQIKIDEAEEKVRKKKEDRIKSAEFITAQIEERKQQRQREKEEEAERVRMEQEAAKLYVKKIDKLYELKLGVPNHKRKKVQWYY
eukprot:g521.t1